VLNGRTGDENGRASGAIAQHGPMESRDRDSLITNSVVQEMSEWYDRALDCVYPVSFVDVNPVVRFISQHTLRPRSSRALGLTETEQKPVAQPRNGESFRCVSNV
jgi:hypothetical protein